MDAVIVRIGGVVFSLPEIGQGIAFKYETIDGKGDGTGVLIFSKRLALDLLVGIEKILGDGFPEAELDEALGVRLAQDAGRHNTVQKVILEYDDKTDPTSVRLRLTMSDNAESQFWLLPTVCMTIKRKIRELLVN